MRIPHQPTKSAHQMDGGLEGPTDHQYVVVLFSQRRIKPPIAAATTTVLDERWKEWDQARPYIKKATFGKKIFVGCWW